jgi:hypothetical protein
LGIARSYGLPSESFSAKDRGYGFWQWKFLLISHYCNAGFDYVVYIDAGCDVNSRSLIGLLAWFNGQKEFDLVLSRTGVSVSQYTKPSAIKYFQERFGSTFYNLSSLEMLQAGFVLLKPCTVAAALYGKATSLVIQGRKYLFDDTRVCQEDLDGLYVEHRHDQAVLNLLLIASAEPNKVGVLHSSLTPPQHLNGWQGFDPPVIASRNWSCLPMYNLVLRFNSYSDAPKIIRFAWRFLHIIAKQMNYPSSLLISYAWLEKFLLAFPKKSASSAALFQGDCVATAPVVLSDPRA